MNNIFKIKKEERLFALVAFLLIVAFNVLMVPTTMQISARMEM